MPYALIAIRINLLHFFASEQTFYDFRDIKPGLHVRISKRTVPKCLMRFTAFSERNFQISDGLFCILHLQPAVFLLFLNEAGDVLCVVIAEFLALRSQCLLQSWRVGHVELPHGLTVVCDNHCPVSRQFTDEKLHLTVCSRRS